MSAFPIPGLITKPENIPARLQELPWVLWKPWLRGAKVKKLPLDWRSPLGDSIDVSNPNHYCTFDQAVWAMRQDPEGRFGIGYVQTPGCGILTFDGDGPRSYQFLDSLNAARQSYYTQSVSGVGRHLVMNGVLPHGRGSLMLTSEGIEVYAHDRFMAETGITLPQGNGHIADCPEGMFANIGPIRTANGGLTTELGRVLDASDGDVARAWMQCFPVWRTYAEQYEDLADRSETFKWMIGDLDKITGDPEQIHRVMSMAPMLRHNSYNRSKFERLFDGWIMDARRSNTQGPQGGVPRIYWHDMVRHGYEQHVAIQTQKQLLRIEQAAANNAAKEEVVGKAKPEPVNEPEEFDPTPRMQIKPPTGPKARALYNEVLEFMHYPNATIAWVATVSMIAAIAHRSCFVEGDISIAHAIMLLSVTGDGKQTATDMFGALARVIAHTKDPQAHAANALLLQSISGEFSHASAIGDKLAVQPRITAIIPEGGYLLGTSETVSQADFSAMQELMRIRTSGDYGQSLPPKSYAKGGNRGGADRPRIECPSLNIVADSQPSTVYSLIQHHSAEKGTLNRWWLIDATRDWRGKRNKNARKRFSLEVADDLLALASSVAHVEHACVSQPGVKKPSQGGGIDMGSKPPIPITLTAEAIEVCDLYEERVLDRLSDVRDPMEKAIFVRSLVAAKALAGVLAVYEHGAQGGAYVDETTMRYALDVAYVERSDLLHKFRSGQIGSGDNQRFASLVRVIRHTYVDSRSKHLSKKGKELNLVTYNWISDCLKDLSCFTQGGSKGTGTLLKETIEDALRKGILRPASPDHGLRGQVWEIDWDVIKAIK